MLAWQSLILMLMVFLLNAWPVTLPNELLVFNMHNHSEISMALWEQKFVEPNCYCWLLLVQLQGSECPFMKLLLISIAMLPVYNLMLILIGWRLNKCASCKAQRMVLFIHPITRRSAPAPPVLKPAPPLRPLPPPRCKRRKAPKPPPSQLHSSQGSVNKYPSQKDPFATMQEHHHQDRYKSLRRNLKRVLEGLQQEHPLPLGLPLPSPQQLPLPHCHTSNLNELSAYSSSFALNEELPKHKAKSRNMIRTLLKRLGKPFAKKEGKEGKAESCRSSGSSGSSGNKSSILQPIWQRLKFRSSRKANFELPLASSSSDSNCSSVCLFAY